MKALVFVLMSLGTFRVWRFIGRDDLTVGIRVHLPPFILKGVTCPWCLGSWLSIAAAFVVDRIYVLPPHWGLWAAGVAGAVGFLGELDWKLQK